LRHVSVPLLGGVLAAPRVRLRAEGPCLVRPRDAPAADRGARAGWRRLRRSDQAGVDLIGETFSPPWPERDRRGGPAGAV